MARIIISSYLIRLPVGGYESWMLQWMLGLKALGHDVYFFERSGWKGSCTNPLNWTCSDDCSYGLREVSRFFKRFGFAEKWTFQDAAGEFHGLTEKAVLETFRSADLYIDHLRVCEWAEEAARIPVRILVDGEPGMTQIMMARNERFPGMSFTHYYTVGLNVGRQAEIPVLGHEWQQIFDPVIPSLFEASPPEAEAPVTTIMSWKAHETIRHNGRVFGQKDVEFEKFLDLPARCASRLELSVAGGEDENGGVPLARLRSAGWHLRDSGRVTRSFDAWKSYIAGSLAEFSVCKNIFVATRSGFFSDRAAAYLASGRPVVMQDTGFSEHLPTGNGLFAVNDVEEAAEAIRRIAADPAAQGLAAREIACEHLDAERVLCRMLEQVGL